jgi:SAM-dependent methyltransferase
MPLSVALARIRSSLSKRGVIGTAAVLLADLARFSRRRAFYALETIFDSWHSVNTRGVVWQPELGVVDPAVEHAAHYVGTYPRSFRRFLRFLDIEYSRYAFVDLGSGKGKALLLASEFPFQSVTGVELSPRLTQTALENLSRARRFNRACRNVQVITGNAADFAFPSKPLIVYLHNPFDAAVIEPVLAALATATRESSLPSYIVYHGPFHRAVMDGASWLHVARTFRKCVIFHTV